MGTRLQEKKQAEQENENSMNTAHSQQIEVYNDNSLVFVGSAEQMIIDNQNDPDVAEMVTEALTEGNSERLFFSGLWQVKAI
jgi:hypothetical protein